MRMSEINLEKQAFVYKLGFIFSADLMLPVFMWLVIPVWPLQWIVNANILCKLHIPYQLSQYFKK